MKNEGFLTLKAVAELFEGAVSVSSLRREVRAGRLKCIRARPGCNSKILVSYEEFKRWLLEDAGTRQQAQSPTAAAHGRSAA